MSRTAPSFVAAVMAVFMFTCLGSDAQAQNFVFVEQGDAPNIFADAQFAGAFSIRGSLPLNDPGDIYEVCEESTVPMIHRIFTETSINPVGRPTPSQLFASHGNSLSESFWAEQGFRDFRSNFVGLWPGPGCHQVGVSLSSRSSPTPRLIDNPLRIDATGLLASPMEWYEIRRLASPRLRADQIQVLPQREINDLRDSRIVTVECDEVQAATWTYRAREVGDVERVMVRLGDSCTGYVIRTYANNGGNCIELRPDGSVVQARYSNIRHLDFQGTPGIYPSPAPFQDGRERGSMCTQPVTAGNVVVSGVVLLEDNRPVREPGDCMTCVNNRASAGHVRISQVIIQFIKPAVTWADVPVQVLRDSATGQGMVLVARTNSRQISGYHVALPDLGFTADLASVTDLNAATRWSRPGLVVDTLWIPPGVLPLSGPVRVVLTPLGSDGHWDWARLDNLRFEVTTSVMVSDEDGPPTAGSGFELSVYPNPATSRATVRITSLVPQGVELGVYDIHGRQIMNLSEVVPAGTSAVALDTRGLAAGVYVVRVTDGAGSVASARFWVLTRN